MPSPRPPPDGRGREWPPPRWEGNGTLWRRGRRGRGLLRLHARLLQIHPHALVEPRAQRLDVAARFLAGVLHHFVLRAALDLARDRRLPYVHDADAARLAGQLGELHGLEEALQL